MQSGANEESTRNGKIHAGRGSGGSGGTHDAPKPGLLAPGRQITPLGHTETAAGARGQCSRTCSGRFLALGRSGATARPSTDPRASMLETVCAAVILLNVLAAGCGELPERSVPWPTPAPTGCCMRRRVIAGALLEPGGARAQAGGAAPPLAARHRRRSPSPLPSLTPTPLLPARPPPSSRRAGAQPGQAATPAARAVRRLPPPLPLHRRDARAVRRGTSLDAFRAQRQGSRGFLRTRLTLLRRSCAPSLLH